MSVIESIIDWAEKDLLNWQSDAVRRLLTQEKLTVEDKSQILYMVKELYGLNSNAQPVEPKPLERKHIPSKYNRPMKLTLKAMNNLQNVNAIPDDSYLSFGHEGLSVIYGENGAGKSGYARVLKRACNARDSKEKIIPNIFENKTDDKVKANFKFSIDDNTDQEFCWENNMDGQSPLSYINVFDSKSANIIVDEKNEVIYLPEGAQVFEGLVSLMKTLKDNLEHEKPNIKRLSYKDIDINTRAGQIIEELNHASSVEEVKSFGVWNDSDETMLKKISKELADLEYYDPLIQAKKIRQFKNRIESMAKKINKIEITLSEKNTDKLKHSIGKYKEVERAVKFASQSNQIDTPLEGFGESAWQILYKAAKEYSINFAYPNKDFPVINEDSRCVLCMQTLSEDAKARMQSFSNFMKDTTKQQEEEAAEELESWEKYLRGIEIPSLESIRDILDYLRDIGENTCVEGFIKDAEKRSKEMIWECSAKQELRLSPMNHSPKQDLIRIIGQLDNEAKEKEKQADPETKTKMKTKQKELKARRTFTQRKSEILEYLSQLKLIHRYEECINQLKTNAITRKGNSIISSNLTPKLIESLENEINDLGVTHLPLILKSSGSGGETRHQISLGETGQRVKLSEILSEGEQRIVALAGFFAELKLGEHECPIIFDDPVSSLDHRYRENIAERLIKESTDRQVIVFTHDIAFLLALENKAYESVDDVCFTSQTVQRIGDRSGNITNSRPWHAMNVTRRIKYLKNELNNFKGLFRSNLEKYNENAAKCYGLLRETWESLIEDILFNESIRRHSPEIQTQKIRSVEVTTEYVKRINLGMSKCSKWMVGHDKSMFLDKNHPSPEEIKQDIEEIDKFRKELLNRGKSVKKERDAALSPKTPAIG